MLFLLPKISRYVKNFKDSNAIVFTKDEESLKKTLKIKNKVKSITRKKSSVNQK